MIRRHLIWKTIRTPKIPSKMLTNRETETLLYLQRLVFAGKL